MTRETKIGLAVAASFLCLVGIVVATKYRGREVDQNVAPSQTASQGNGAPKPPDKKAQAVAAASQSNQQPQFRAPGSNEESGNTGVTTTGQANAGNNSATVVLPLAANSGVDHSVPTLPPPPTFANPSNLPPAPLANAAPQSDPAIALADLIKRQQEQQAPPLPPTGFGNKIDNALNNFFAKADDAKNKADRAVDNGVNHIDKQMVNGANRGNDAINKGIDGANRGIDTGINKLNDFLNKNVNDPANKGIDNFNRNIDRSLDNIPVNKGIDNFNRNIDRGVDSINKNVNDPVNRGFDNLNKNIDKGLDNLNKNLPPPPTFDNSQLPPPPTIGVAAPMTPSVPPLPTFANPANPAPMIPQPTPGNNNPLPTVTSLPPITTTPKNDVPRPAIPAPPMVAALPQNANNNPGFVIPAPGNSTATVMVHDMQSYQVRGGETFASVSQHAYGSDRYAAALQMYNRDYGPNRTVTTLQAGQMVMLPPLQFLQERYASAIGDARSNITNVSVAPVSINPPVPMPVPMPNTTPTLPTTDATKTYRVPAEGQLLYAIALQTMGDGNRWSEIYRLNPNLQPLQPVPGGTMLRLPSNAKVP
jgi:hypothetical protein